MNTEEEQFGIERLKSYVTQHVNSNAHDILEGIFEEVSEFGNRSAWEDDVTLLIVKRSPDDGRIH